MMCENGNDASLIHLKGKSSGNRRKVGGVSPRLQRESSITSTENMPRLYRSCSSARMLGGGQESNCDRKQHLQRGIFYRGNISRFLLSCNGNGLRASNWLEWDAVAHTATSPNLNHTEKKYGRFEHTLTQWSECGNTRTRLYGSIYHIMVSPEFWRILL